MNKAQVNNFDLSEEAFEQPPEELINQKKKKSDRDSFSSDIVIKEPASS